MPGMLAGLLALPARIAQLEARLEALATLVAARGAPPGLSRSVYLGDHTALAMLEGRLPIYVDTRGRDIAPHLLLHGVWEAEELRVFRRMLRPGDLVLDLGAHVGVYTLAAAEAVGAQGRVHAFEPHPRNAGLLRRSLEVNGFAGIAEVHLLAAGATAGASTLLVTPEWEGGGFLDRAMPSAVPRADGRQALTVRVVALDTIFADPATRPNFDPLRVTSTIPRARACPAMSTSYVPMGVPFAASKARISPASRASSRPNSRMPKRSPSTSATFLSVRALLKAP